MRDLVVIGGSVVGLKTLCTLIVFSDATPSELRAPLANDAHYCLPSKTLPSLREV